jgi:hypothetical protein
VHRRRLAGRGATAKLPQTAGDAVAWLGALFDRVDHAPLGEAFNRYVPASLANELPVPWDVGDSVDARLSDAVMRDDLAAARMALRDGADVDAMPDALTMLELALRNASAEMVLLLLDAGASLAPVPFERREQCTPSVQRRCRDVIAKWQAMSPCPPELSFLLEDRTEDLFTLTLEEFERAEREAHLARATFDGDKPENHGPRPSNARSGNDTVIEPVDRTLRTAALDREVLRSFSCELDVEEDGLCSPLAWACWRGDRELVVTLLERGAHHPTNVPEWVVDDHPLSLAAHHRDLVLFDRLLEVGLRVDDDPLIMRAIAWRGDHATVQRALGSPGGAAAGTAALSTFVDARIVEPALRLLEAGAVLDETDDRVLLGVASLDEDGRLAIANFASERWRRRLAQQLDEAAPR